MISSAVAFATLVLVAGFRDRSVGTDTEAYVNGFANLRTFADAWKESSLEPGYLILTYVTRAISSDYWVLLTAIALVVVFCFMRSIYMFSDSPAISLFVFITMGYYTFFFNGARQGLAFAIYSLAIGPLIHGNFKKYAFWVLVAFCFHKSVIVALPLYFLFRQKNTLRYVLQMVAVATITILYFSTFLNIGVLISDKYMIYQELEATGGELLTLFYVLLSVFFFYFKYAIPLSERQRYDCLLNMLIFGSTIFVVVSLSGGYVELTRLAIYFQMASIFLWPIVLRNIRKSKKRFLFEYAFALSHIGYFYIFINKMAGLVPYKINETLMHNLWFF
ncbi:MAG: EpsG family protein [Spirochaetales bacterium]|nr:EpsG family protein [Spirochaetales bacterium]